MPDVAKGPRKKNRNQELPPWSERLAALGAVPRFLRLAWHTHRGFATATILLRLLRASAPVAMLWVGKLIIDTVMAARLGDMDTSRLWTLLSVEILIAVVSEALGKASVVVEGLFGDLCSNEMSVRLIRHAATLDLRHFEDPAFYDQLERAQRQTTGRIGLMGQLLSVGQDGVTLVSLAGAVFLYSPWLLVLLVLAGCDLQNVRLVDRNLNFALLAGANLQGAVLTGTTLRGAALKGASFFGADLKGTDLTGATDANLAGAVTNELTICPSGQPGPCAG